jgi:endonuclease YncB( thermonuclease family)
MTRDEAEARAAALNEAGQGDRWFARDEGSDTWSVIRVSGIPTPERPEGTLSEARPPTSEPADPRLPETKEFGRL